MNVLNATHLVPDLVETDVQNSDENFTDDDASTRPNTVEQESDMRNSENQAEKDLESEQSSETSVKSLYSELETKNQAIDILKRQLMNQEFQLAYYLHKNLGAKAVLEFSNQCIPHLVDDNTQLSLAMYKFIRDTNGKSRLSQLRERLEEYNHRVYRALVRQEYLLKKGLGFDENDDWSNVIQDLDVVEEEEDDGDGLTFSVKAFHVAQMDLCSRLMSSTLLVQKELERFRACAERIVCLEEERNALVDRVYSLPAEQRFVGIRIIDSEMAKRQESIESSMISTSTETFPDEGNKGLASNQLEEMLREMDNEAHKLLQISEKQKTEYVGELQIAREENKKLRDKLQLIEAAASTGLLPAPTADDQVLKLQQKCETIEAEIEEMRGGFEEEQTEKERELKRLEEEVAKHLQIEKDLEQEASELKATVDTLIRDENPKVAELTDMVAIQEDQIKSLLSIISQLDCCDRGDSVVSAPAEIVHDMPSIALTRVDESMDSGVDSPSKTEHEDACVHKPEKVDVFYEKFNNEPDELHESSAESPKLDDDKSEISRSRSRRKCFTNMSSRPNLACPRRPKLTTTSLRVEAYDKDGKSESMHAVLESSSPVEGVLEMDNSSKLRLRLQCTSPSRSEYEGSYTTVNKKEESSSFYSETKHVVGDHNRPSDTKTSVTQSCQLSRDAKLYLTKQLDKIKLELEKSNSESDCCKNIVRNINEMYLQLFGTE